VSTTASKRIESRILPAPGCASPTVALKVAEIADVHAQLRAAIRGLPPAAFAWQPAPRTNTIGMLVAHVALAEVNLAQVVLLAEPRGHTPDVLGLTTDDDGMPIEKYGSTPPAVLAGKDEAFFQSLIEKAEAHTFAACRTLREEQLGDEIARPPRPDGSYRVFDRRWALHHMVEHMAQHLGQLHVLKRQWKAAQPAG
jgi:uncharacterized damage-inducible protein DinB